MSTLLSGCEMQNLNRIRRMIKLCVWCPPLRVFRGLHKCILCEEDINLDRHEPNYYTVWCGLICLRCHTSYNAFIEELSQL